MHDDMHDAEAERRERIRAERLARWEAGTPPVFRRSWPMHPDVAKWTAGLVAGEATNLALIGDPGTTKTWHCYAAIRQALLDGYDGGARLYTAKDWRRAVAPPVDFATLDRMAETGVVVLDDLGATRISDWDAENLLLMLDERWKFQRPTVVTSNVFDLKAMLGDRIASRLGADIVKVIIDGPDRRREG